MEGKHGKPAVRGVPKSNYRDEDDVRGGAIEALKKKSEKDKKMVINRDKPSDATKEFFNNLGKLLASPDLVERGVQSLQNMKGSKFLPMAALGAGCLKLFADDSNRPNTIRVDKDEGIGTEMLDCPKRNYDMIQIGTIGRIHDLDRLREYGDFTNLHFVSGPSSPISDKVYRFACVAKREEEFGYVTFETLGGQGADRVPSDVWQEYGQVRARGSKVGAPASELGSQEIFYTTGFPESVNGLLNMSKIKWARYNNWIQILEDVRFTNESTVRLSDRIAGLHTKGEEWAEQLKKNAGIDAADEARYRELGQPEPGKAYSKRDEKIDVVDVKKAWDREDSSPSSPESSGDGKASKAKRAESRKQPNASTPDAKRNEYTTREDTGSLTRKQTRAGKTKMTAQEKLAKLDAEMDEYFASPKNHSSPGPGTPDAADETNHNQKQSPAEVFPTDRPRPPRVKKAHNIWQPRDPKPLMSMTTDNTKKGRKRGPSDGEDRDYANKRVRGGRGGN